MVNNLYLHKTESATQVTSSNTQSVERPTTGQKCWQVTFFLVPRQSEAKTTNIIIIIISHRSSGGIRDKGKVYVMDVLGFIM